MDSLLSSLPELSHFNDVYIPHLYNLSRTQIYYGGSSSGKSVFLAQRCAYDVRTGGRNYLVCRQVGRTLRGSVFSEIKKAIADLGWSDEFKVNQTDMLITHQNGYQIIFAGLDDVEKLKSLTPAKGAITDIWIEEATETDPKTVKQLRKRQRGGDPNTPKRLILSFNPILQSHWIYQEFFAGIAWADDQTEYQTPKLSILKTWYIHNRFLTPDDIWDLENEPDPYFRDVYTFGKWGVLGNVIFTNWKVQDLAGMRKQFTNRRIGLDFGFSGDPAAVPVTHYDRSHKTIYVFAELYERGLTNDLLADEIKQMICSQYVGRDANGGRVFIQKDIYLANREALEEKYQGMKPFDIGDTITADSAEPKSIAELRGYGLNVIGAEKGKDSVLFGIQWLQQQIIIIDSQCVNTRNEFMQYHWKEDKDGNAIRQPVDKNNHIIDGLRYAYEQDSAAGASWDDIQELGKIGSFRSRWQ